MYLDGSRRLKSLEALGDVPQSPVGDNLADHLPVRRHADYNEAALAAQEGAKRLPGTGQLAGALLELHGAGFATADESFDFRDCLGVSAPPPAVNPVLGRREEWLFLNHRHFTTAAVIGAWTSAAVRPLRRGAENGVSNGESVRKPSSCRAKTYAETSLAC